MTVNIGIFSSIFCWIIIIAGMLIPASLIYLVTKTVIAPIVKHPSRIAFWFIFLVFIVVMIFATCIF